MRRPPSYGSTSLRELRCIGLVLEHLTESQSHYGCDNEESNLTCPRTVLPPLRSVIELLMMPEAPFLVLLSLAPVWSSRHAEQR